MAKPTASAKDILFEIGCEELPATTLADLFGSGGPDPLGEKLRAALADKRIEHGALKVYVTPRRLVFHVAQAAPRQTAKENLVRIMAHDGAYNADGTPSEKLSSILQHRKAAPERLVVEESQGKRFVFLKESLPSEPTEKVLPELLAAFVRGMGFSKNMRWDDSGLVFPRPIRSFMCLYGAKPVAFTIGRITAAPRTRLFQKAKFVTVPVKSIPAYFSLLKARGVILDPKLRKADIERQLASTAKSAGGRLYEDPFLLNEVNFLTESPSALAAPFGEEFLSLPLEVLTVSMARKQRIFGLLDREGRVLPKFIGVLDGRPAAADKKNISKNYEKILHAKLQDSLFFYREDLKVPLSQKRAELKDLVFLKNAGSMLEKSERLEALAKTFFPEAARAAHLSKADLLTQMVGEFPELQGVMGRYYAEKGRESRETALAIGEQYLPRTVSDRLPETQAGAALSVFDKIDLITACYALGLEPSSSLDPYGLRRSASALLKIMIDKGLDLPLGKLIDETIGLLGAYVPKDKASGLRGKVMGLLKDRLKALLADRGHREDLAEAVLSSGFDRVPEAYRRLELLGRVQDRPSFRQACKVVERLSNILRGNKEALPERPDPSVFTEDLERELHAAYVSAEGGVRAAIAGGDLERATGLYAGAFFDIVGRFFELVFVNAPDLTVRRNRLSLLKAVQGLYTREIADLSKIKQEGS